MILTMAPIKHLSYTLLVVTAALILQQTSALLIQPHNYMLDDSASISLIDPLQKYAGRHEHQQDVGATSLNIHNAENVENIDNDLFGYLKDNVNRLKYGRFLSDSDDESGSNLAISEELSDLLNEKQQQQGKDGIMSESVADIILNAAANSVSAASNHDSNQQASDGQQQPASDQESASSASSLQTSAVRQPFSKESNQWYNPKELIPALKISAMATPSKYKKVYFKAEKKLVDGAFHQDGSELGEKKEHHRTSDLLFKPLRARNSREVGAQRRSSRASSSPAAAPQNLFENGVIDFLKKFRDVYIQTRPVVPASGSSSLSSSSSSSPSLSFSAMDFATNFLTSAALSPVFSVPNSSQKPISSSGVANAAASPNSAQTSGTPTGVAGQNTNKSPFSAQTYVSFWSKTFPTWVRKTLKQFRRRSLQNSNRRQQQKHNQQTASNLAVQAASGAMKNVASPSSDSSSSSSSSSNSGSGSLRRR